jgi:hypothetical protein
LLIGFSATAQKMNRVEVVQAALANNDQIKAAEFQTEQAKST